MKVKYLDIYKYAVLLSRIREFNIEIDIEYALIISEVIEYMSTYVKKVESKRDKIRKMLELEELSQEKGQELMNKFLLTNVTLKDFTEDMLLPKAFLLSLDVKLSINDINCIKKFIV